MVLDFLQAIHAAEQRQAELDARVYSEEKRMMKVRITSNSLVLKIEIQLFSTFTRYLL